MIVDLHSHTSESDGEYTPKKLIDKAIEKNLSVLAITDHDTIDGLDEAITYAKNKDIEIVPGIEFNTKTNIGKMHILGLNIDYSNKELINVTNKLKEDRNVRNNKFIKLFQQLGFNINIEDVIPKGLEYKNSYYEFLGKIPQEEVRNIARNILY